QGGGVMFPGVEQDRLGNVPGRAGGRKRCRDRVDGAPPSHGGGAGGKRGIRYKFREVPGIPTKEGCMLPRGGGTEGISRDSLRGVKGSTGGRSRMGGFALPIACVIQKDAPLRCGFAGWLHFSAAHSLLYTRRSVAPCSIEYAPRPLSRRSQSATVASESLKTATANFALRLIR